MKPVHVKEALSLLDRIHLFAIQNEGDGSLQHAVEGVINITYYLFKETNINFIYLLSFIFKCFLYVYAVLEFLS